MTKRGVERRLRDLEADESGSTTDVVEHLRNGGGVEVCYSNGDGSVHDPDGEHIPESRVEVLEDYGDFRWIDVQDEENSPAGGDTEA